MHTWFTHYLKVIVENTRWLMDYGAFGPDARPTGGTDYAMLFDLDALDLERVTYIIGFYFYILASHKKSNWYLMQENETRRIL